MQGADIEFGALDRDLRAGAARRLSRALAEKHDAVIAEAELARRRRLHLRLDQIRPDEGTDWQGFEPINGVLRFNSGLTRDFKRVYLGLFDMFILAVR